MRVLNKVTLLGNVGKVPERQTLEGGAGVVKFSLATTEGYRDKEGKQDTEWHNMVAWPSLAEVAGKYIRKGSHNYLELKIKTCSYEDKEKQKSRWRRLSRIASSGSTNLQRKAIYTQLLSKIQR